jgi:hypothetical protein
MTLSELLTEESACEVCDLENFSNHYGENKEIFANPMGKGWWLVFDVTLGEWTLQKRDHSKVEASLEVKCCPICGKKLPILKKP